MGWEFKKCCFCIDLRIGSLIIGYLHLLGGSLAVSGAIFLFINGLKQTQKDNLLLGILGTNMVLRFFSLLFTIALLYGLHKDAYKYLQPYLMYNALLVIFYIIDMSISLAFGVVVVNVVSNVLSILITIYFLLVIRSYCLELKRRGNAMTPAEMYARPAYPPPDGGAVTVVYNPPQQQV